MIEHLEFKAQFTAQEDGTVEGLAWPFGTPDRVGDMFTKGAITAPETLPMLFGHDQGQVIGVWDQIAETAEGLTVKGRLLINDVARAREVRAMITSKAVSGLSIGFVTKASTPLGRELRTQGELLREVAETIRRARTEQERAAIAQAAFGDVGRRMAQTLSGGSDAIDRMIREAREAGHVIDSELIDRAEVLEDRFDDLTRSAGNFFKSIIVDAADAVVSLADVRFAFEDLLRASEGRTREAMGDGIAGALDEDGFRRAAEAVGEYDRAIAQMRAQAQATIQQLDMFSQNLAMIGDHPRTDRT